MSIAVDAIGVESIVSTPTDALASSPALIAAREFAVEFDPGIWTDIWPYVVAVSTRRGRNAELGAFETGRGFVTLRNETRIFDPDYAAGPLAGKLRPNRRVRLRATHAGVTHPVMVGYIDRISQTTPGPNEAVTVIAFSDLFKVLERQELPRSVFVSTLAAAAPDLWFALDEPAGSATVADQGAGRMRATVKPGSTLGAAGLVTRDPGSAMATALGNPGIVIDRTLYPGAAVTGTSAFTVAGWMAAGAQTAPDDLGTLAAQSGPINAFFQVAVLSPNYGADAGKIEFRIGLTPWVRSTIAVTDGSPHHWMATRGADGVMKIYIDGVDRTATLATSTVSIPEGGELSWGSSPGGGYEYVGTLQHVAVWRTSAVTAAEAAAMNAAGRTPWDDDLPGARIARVLDLAAVATDDRDLDAGTTPLQSTSLGGTALGYIQRVGDTDLGSVFVTRDGKLRYLGRREGAGEDPFYLTSQATLADTPVGAGEVPYRGVDLEVDDADIVTRATVSREGGVAVTYEDAAAIDEFGIVTYTAEGLLHDSESYSGHVAEWVVNTRKAPESRVGALAVTPLVDPATVFPKLLALEIGDRVTLKKRPRVGAAIQADFRLEAVAHETGGAYWTATLQLTPFDQAAGLPVFIWGVTRWGQHVWGL